MEKRIVALYRGTEEEDLNQQGRDAFEDCKGMKVALYLRVSTDKQTYDSQLKELMEFCKTNKYETDTEHIYQETISGKEANRSEFKRMMHNAELHRFDAILVWASDRFTREGGYKFIEYLSLLNKFDVGYISYKEQMLNTMGPFAPVMYAFLGVMAELERIRISERTKSSMGYVKQKIDIDGSYFSKRLQKKITKFGAPEKQIDSKIVMEMRMQKKTVREIAHHFNCSTSPIMRILKSKPSSAQAQPHPAP